MMRRFSPYAVRAAAAAAVGTLPLRNINSNSNIHLSPSATVATSLSGSRRFASTTATAAAPAASSSNNNNNNDNNSAAKPDIMPAAYDFPNVVLKNRVWATHHTPHRHIQVYLDSEALLWVVMNRQGSSANALGQEFVEDLAAALDICAEYFAGKHKSNNEAASGGHVVSPSAVILTSAKTTFCVGADIDQMYPITDAAVAAKIPSGGHELFNRIEAAPFPIIAAINGLALGGGLELALACHYRVISSAGGAKVGFPECLLGLLPGGGGTVRTQRLAGVPATAQCILASSQMKPAKAKKMGIVDLVLEGEDRYAGEARFVQGVRRWAGATLSGVPKSAFLKKAAARRPKLSLTDRLLGGTGVGRALVARQSLAMLNKKTGGKYIAQYKALECILYSAHHSDAQGYAKECENFAELLVSPEAKNMMSLYFLDDGMKKSESRTGVPKKSVPPVVQASVIGAGVMGAGIAHYFANKDIPVFLKDLNEAAVAKGKAHVDDLFGAAVKRKRMEPHVGEKKKALVVGVTDNTKMVAAAAAAASSTAEKPGVNLIVEAAVEVMSVKKKIVAELEKDGALNGANTIFASNTSSLSITELQEGAAHPQNIVGMHFFNPVDKMPLVEVIVGKQTDAKTAAVIFETALRTGKKPIIVKDRPGFLVNRILGVYMSEAGRIAVHHGVHPSVIDKAMKQTFGMPMGPFRLLDEVGLDVACHVGPILQNGLNVAGVSSADFPIRGDGRFIVGGGVEAMLKDGILGRKSGKGFYKYDKAGGKETGGIDEQLLTKYFGKLGGGNTSLSAWDIIDRCVLLMVNEAALILSEGIVQSAADVDIGMVFGTGFAPYRGGLLQHADHRGAAQIVARLAEIRAQEEKLLAGGRGKSEDADPARFAPAPLLEKMAKENGRFHPDRPLVPYKERKGFPTIKY